MPPYQLKLVDDSGSDSGDDDEKQKLQVIMMMIWKLKVKWIL